VLDFVTVLRWTTLH